MRTFEEQWGWSTTHTMRMKNAAPRKRWRINSIESHSHWRQQAAYILSACMGSVRDNLEVAIDPTPMMVSSQVGLAASVGE